MLFYLTLFVGIFVGMCVGGFVEYNDGGYYKDVILGCIYGAAAGAIFSLPAAIFFGIMK